MLRASLLSGLLLFTFAASLNGSSMTANEDQEEIAESGSAEEGPETPSKWETARNPPWIHSGKFQGDIDGIDEQLLRQLQDPGVQFNALRNRQLIWPNGVIPYELDEAFTLGEIRLLQRAFRTYRRRTLGCIRFRPKRGQGELDYLNIVKGNGCYSQVGKTGGKQELSLGRGCLFNETIIHELMHSLGFWHEHSRADRDEHIVIRWENILPGMDSQFDVVSAAIQDTLGEPYDYKSIMHYGSMAFSRNGRNTLEAVIDEYTNVIGTAIELSELDVAKIMKLYHCRRKDSRTSSNGTWRRRRPRPNQSPTTEGSADFLEPKSPSSFPLSENTEMPEIQTSTQKSETEPPEIDEAMKKPTWRRRCRDHFLDCSQFGDYCERISFYFIMRSYCPKTCGRCNNDAEKEQ